MDNLALLGNLSDHIAIPLCMFGADILITFYLKSFNIHLSKVTKCTLKHITILQSVINDKWQVSGLPHDRAAQCIDKEILISKNGNIDIDIEIDKRMF